MRALTTKLARGALVVSLAAAVTPLTAVPGQAATSQCAAEGGTPFCVWRQAGYASTYGRWYGPVADLTQWPQGGCYQGTWNDCDGSVWNRSSTLTVPMYRDINYDGNNGVMADGVAYPGAMVTPLNSSISQNMSSFNMYHYGS